MRRLIRFWLWVPFWLLTRPVLVGGIVIGLTCLRPSAFVAIFVTMGVTSGLCMPIEARLRPLSRGGKSRLPARPKPMGWARVKLAVRQRGSAAKLSAIARRLPPGLRALLASPHQRQPEAIAHGNRLLHQQQAVAK